MRTTIMSYSLQSRSVNHIPCGSTQKKCPLTWHTAGGFSCILPPLQASSSSDADQSVLLRVIKAFTLLKGERCILKVTSGSLSWQLYLFLFVLHSLIFYSKH